MVTTINDRPCYIFWKYIRKNNPNKLGFDKKNTIDKDETICIIKDTETQKELFYGIAITSNKDNFQKESGRKISLKKAISSLSKEDRTIVWNDYLNR